MTNDKTKSRRSSLFNRIAPKVAVGAIALIVGGGVIHLSRVDAKIKAKVYFASETERLQRSYRDKNRRTEAELRERYSGVNEDPDVFDLTELGVLVRDAGHDGLVGTLTRIRVYNSNNDPNVDPGREGVFEHEDIVYIPMKTARKLLGKE